MKHGWLSAAAVAWLAAGAVEVYAQPEQPSGTSTPIAEELEVAKRLYQRAEEYKLAGDERAARGDADQARELYGRAVKDYMEGYRLSELPLFLYNLGSAYRLRGDTKWAIRCYQAFLATEPESDEDVKDTRMFLAELRRDLAGSALPEPAEPELRPSGVCMLADAPPPPALPPPDEPVSSSSNKYRAAFWSVTGATVLSMWAASSSDGNNRSVLFGLSLGGGVTAGYLFYKGYMNTEATDEAARPATALRPVLGPTAVGAELSWRF